MAHKFQIDLSGIIQLLSSHLYSSPQVYLRELLQNGVDAISARKQSEPQHEGRIHLHLLSDAETNTPTLVFADNGIGLTEDEIHRFLATIGQSSKRGAAAFDRHDFIGQFGIGLLSCFVVSDEIVVQTRSSKADGKALEWCGRADGTYSITALPTERAPGTSVTLRCKPGSEEFFAADRIEELARHFGGLLPYPITVTTSAGTRQINEEQPPWREEFVSPDQEREAYLQYGRQMFGLEFFDYIKLQSHVGAVQGVAFVLPFSPSLAVKKTHRVYLKNMLLSETAEGLLPEWAFFVKSVVNANDLRPTASRESFYEDDALATTRETLGGCLRAYLLDLAQHDKPRLQKLISLHYMSIKALAVADDDFYRIFIEWLPFETSQGWMSLGEYLKQNSVIRYVRELDQFRQIASIASAQSLCIINGSYAYDAELLRNYEELFPETMVEQVNAATLTHSFDFLTLDEQDSTADFLQRADDVLQTFQCVADIRRFAPRDLPALYIVSSDGAFRRSITQAKEVTDSLWSSVLDNLAGDEETAEAQLCFNYNNSLVQKLTRVQDKEMATRLIQLLYVQALLFGHRPLHAREMRLLNEGLLGLIEWRVDSLDNVDIAGGWIQ